MSGSLVSVVIWAVTLMSGVYAHLRAGRRVAFALGRDNRFDVEHIAGLRRPIRLPRIVTGASVRGRSG
jgi:hypothetical protein